MAFARTDGIGGQAITDVSTTQNHPWGYRVRAYDATYGEGEFVYVKGITSGAAGLMATINPYSGVTALTVARSKGLVGILQAALDANTKYGWAQVRGSGMVQVAGTVASGATAYTTATAGKLDDAVVTGDIVYGANFGTADGTPAANQAVLVMTNPYVGDTDNT